MSRCPGCDNRIHCRLCDGGDPVAEARAEEREACATICRKLADAWTEKAKRDPEQPWVSLEHSAAADDCARQIRARATPTGSADR